MGDSLHMQFPTPGTGTGSAGMTKMLKKNEENFRATKSADIQKVEQQAARKEQSAEKNAIADAELEAKSAASKKELCITSPCNIWWVPKGSGCPAAAPCSLEVGCDFLTGKTRPKPMYNWDGF